MSGAYSLVAGRNALCRAALTLAAAGVFALAAAAPEAFAVNDQLRDVLYEAYRNNPRLDSARATQRATDEEVARAQSGFRPLIQGSADTGYNDSNSNPASFSGETRPKGYSVDLIQPLFTGFRTINAVNEAEAIVRAGREQLRNVEQTVLLEATTAYLDIVRDQAVVRLREANVEVLTRDLTATSRRLKSRQATQTDKLQAEVRRAAAQSAQLLSQANLEASRASFERVVGRPPVISAIDPIMAIPALPRTLAEAFEVGQQEHPLIISSLYREQAQRYVIDQIRGELLPTATLEAGHSRRYDSSVIVDEQKTSSVVARVTVPIYTGGETEARVRQAKQQHIARLQDIEQAKADVRAPIQAAWAQVGASRAAVELDKGQVTAARASLAGVRREYDVGQRTLLDILNAQQELLNAQTNLVSDARDYMVANFSLLQAIGRLNIAQLEGNATVYDPDVHYHEVRRKWFGLSITHSDGHTEQYEAVDGDTVKAERVK